MLFHRHVESLVDAIVEERILLDGLFQMGALQEVFFFVLLIRESGHAECLRRIKNAYAKNKTQYIHQKENEEKGKEK